jgi:uncharacterized protein (TIGR03437 family)
MHRFIPFILAAASAFAYGEARTANLPLYFEPNQGQADSRVDFLSRGNGVTSYLNSREAVFNVNGSPVRMLLKGAAVTRPEGTEQLPGTSSYFRGSDQTKWRVGIPQFGKVQYRGVYPGVDVVYYGSQGSLEYDFQIAPGADPSKIRIGYTGASRLRIDDRGDLILSTKTGDMVQKRPSVYQERDGVRTEIAAAYRLAGRGTVTLKIGEYDRSRALVVDPVLKYGTFFGGPGGGGAQKVKLDAAGNVYMGGVLAIPQSDTDPFSSVANSNSGELAVIKFSPSQNAILFVAHIGTTGRNYMDGFNIDSAGAMYLAGRATTPDIPLVNPILKQGTTSTAFFAQSAFFTKIAADGKSIVYSTYFDGNSGSDAIYGITVDTNGNAYIAGLASSSNFPVLNTLYPPGSPNNAFLAKISPSGSLIFSTVYPMVEAFSVALDGAGGVYIGGAASANYFVTQNSIQQTGAWGVPYAAAVKFSTDGQTVLYSTMFGDSVGGGQIQAIAADPQGNLYVAGVTEGDGTFPLVNPVQNHAGSGEDVFVAIINPQGNALTFSTYLGGNGDDWPQDLTMDAAGRIYVVGYTLSSDFPVLNPAPTSVPKVGEGKPYYGFLSAFAPGGQSLLYSMYIGGSVVDDAWGVATDAAGNVYVGGGSNSPDFPVTAAAYQKTNGGASDEFLLILAPDASSQIPAITSTPQVVTFFSAFDAASGPAPQTVALTAPAGVTMTTSVSTTSGGNWLTAALSGTSVATLAPPSPSTSLTVSVNPAGLASADYTGTIQVTAGSATASIPVIFHLTPPPPVLISYSPDPYPLAGPINSVPPGPITIAGTGFQKGASAHVYAGAAGLPISYVLQPFQVTVIDANTVQLYAGIGSSTPLAVAITVSNPYSAESNPLTIQIGNPLPQITAVQNAASGPQGGNLQPVSPGEMITITGVDFGSPLGISAPAGYTTPVTQLADTQVLFDGVPVPLTYVSSSQINAVAPYSLAGKTSVNVTVQYLGVASAATTLPVVPSMVGLFTANSSGTGQASIVNQDASTNSTSNPAALGSTVTLYATGMGATNPQISDNAVPQNTSVQPALPISAMIDNQSANVVSAYAAPGMLGVLVINVQVPASAHVGNAIPVVVQVGSSQSQQGTTMATMATR